MECYCTISDIDRVISLGKRANARLSEQGKKRFDGWCRLYFGNSTPHLSKYMLIAKYEEIARTIYQKQPLLSINGMTKAIKNEINEGLNSDYFGDQ